jgi:hypothetical protein
VPVPVSGKVEIGKEYTHDVGKGPKTVKLISLTNPMNAGVDKEWLTDDKINKDAEGNDGTLDSKDAFVIWKVNGKYTSSSPGKNVKISNLKPLAEAIERKQVVVQKPQPITSIKLLYEYFMKDPDMLGEIEFLKMSKEQQDKSNFKNIIIDIYEKIHHKRNIG